MNEMVLNATSKQIRAQHYDQSKIIYEHTWAWVYNWYI